MNTLGLAISGAGEVLFAALLLGGLLPAVFAMGVRALATETSTGSTVQAARSPGHLAVAAVCFALVIAAVLAGLTFIVASGFGKTLGFEGFLPTIVDKH